MKKYLKLHSILYCFIFFTGIAFTQNTGQTIKGNIVDKQSLQPLKGVQLIITNTLPTLSAISDSNGN